MTVSPRRLALGGLVASALLVAALGPASAALAQTQDDLAQVLDPNQAQGTGQVVLGSGHVDFGPTLNTGEWRVQIHDDTGAPSYWRNPEDVVMQVRDTGLLTVPEGEEYAFLGLEPGTEVWVVPQTRTPEVVWTGWNTQEPNVLASLNLGTTLRILGVQGPGDVSVYLQSGNFGEPQPLWSTLQPFPQDTWIEVNTHTHANWVFSQPGVYLVQVEFEADLLDGSSVSARDTLRFSVGDATDPQAAFAAVFEDAGSPSPGADAAEPGDGEAAEAPAAQTGGDAALGPLLGVVIGVIAAALVVAVVVVILAGRRARSRARASRPTGSGE